MDYFKKIFTKNEAPKTGVLQPNTPQQGPTQQPQTGVRPNQGYPLQTSLNQPAPQQPKDIGFRDAPKQSENPKVNLFSVQPKPVESVIKPSTQVNPQPPMRTIDIYQNKAPEPIAPSQLNDSRSNNVFVDNRRTSKDKGSLETESMKRIITKMGNEEVKIIQKLEGLEKRSFPTPFPNQPSFPDSFPNNLQMQPVSNEQLHNFSKQRLDNKRQQKEVFTNYKQETDFYRRFIPMNEVKKQRLHQEINELKQRSMIQDEPYVNEEDRLIQQELAEIERLKQLAQQNQHGQFQQNPHSYQNNMIPPQHNNIPAYTDMSQDLDYNPYSSHGYKQQMQNMSANYRNDSQYYNQPVQQQNTSGYYQNPNVRQSSDGHMNQIPQRYNNPSYNLTTFMNKNNDDNNRGTSQMMGHMPVSQQIDAFMQNNQGQKPLQAQAPPKPKSNINANNPLLNVI